MNMEKIENRDKYLICLRRTLCISRFNRNKSLSHQLLEHIWISRKLLPRNICIHRRHHLYLVFPNKYPNREIMFFLYFSKLNKKRP